MIAVLFLIPFFTSACAFFLYKNTGKKEILKFDLVQFVYAFVLAPMMFIWLKSFLFYLMRQELEIKLNLTEIFWADSAFSVVFMFVYAFVVIHSLTKSFELKRYRDPLYDVFQHSEFFHLKASHIVVYSGIMFLVTILAMTNVAFPLQIVASKISFYFLLVLSFLSGFFLFSGIWLSNFTKAKFLKIMKLCYALCFLIHVWVYFLADPKFSASLSLYWGSFMMFFSMVIFSFFIEKSTKLTFWVENRMHKEGWSGKKKVFLLSH